MKQQDWQALFGSPTEIFSSRVDGALQGLERHKTKRISTRLIVLAAALAFVTMGVVYAAATGIWDIRQVFGGRHGYFVPENFQSGYDQGYSQTVGAVRFELTDVYLDDGNLYSVFHITSLPDDPAVLYCPGVIGDNHAVDDYRLNPTGDTRTFPEYAQGVGLPLLAVDTWFADPATGKERRSGMVDMWIDDAGELWMACMQEGASAEENELTLLWHVQVTDSRQQRLQASQEVVIPCAPRQETILAVNQLLPDLSLIVDQVTIRRTSININLEVAVHFTEDSHTDQRAVARMRRLGFRLVDQGGNMLPRGVAISGKEQRLDDWNYVYSGYMLCLPGDFVSDEVYIQIYNTNTDTVYGTVQITLPDMAK